MILRGQSREEPEKLEIRVEKVRNAVQERVGESSGGQQWGPAVGVLMGGVQGSNLVAESLTW